MTRWELLKPREKEIIWHYIVLGEKRYTVGKNIGISLSRVREVLSPIYRILGVRDAIDLGFFVGRNYEQVEMDAIALGFDMPKELTIVKETH